MSLFFYFYGEKELTLILIFSVIFNYYYSHLIVKYHHKYILAIGILVDLSFLIYFKYTNFFIDNISRLFNLNIHIANIILPIGISFFTFQGISYLVDVYRQDVKPASSLINFGTYLTLFPQLIAGPIVRYQTVAKEIDNRNETIDDFYKGIKRFCVGLFKKVIIANTLGELVKIMGELSLQTTLSYWLGAIGATLQLYFDFSAYSDMAIGMGLFFGFHFLENFNYPLIASSITDFWRRWHISLSSFFKDYVYIPLGGSKVKKYRHYINIMIVWLCTGFWHGADWNFILWGVFFGILLILEKLFFLKYLRKYHIFGSILTFIIVTFSFVIFNHTNLNDIVTIFKGMLWIDVPLYDINSLYYLRSYLVIIVISLLAMTPLFKNLYYKINDILKDKMVYIDLFGVLFVLIIVTAFLLDASFNPFLYFRF